MLHSIVQSDVIAYLLLPPYSQGQLFCQKMKLNKHGVILILTKICGLLIILLLAGYSKMDSDEQINNQLGI